MKHENNLNNDDYFKLILNWNQLEEARKVMKKLNATDFANLNWPDLLNIALIENKFDFTEFFLNCDINLR